MHNKIFALELTSRVIIDMIPIIGLRVTILACEKIFLTQLSFQRLNKILWVFILSKMRKITINLTLQVFSETYCARIHMNSTSFAKAQKACPVALTFWSSWGLAGSFGAHVVNYRDLPFSGQFITSFLTSRSKMSTERNRKLMTLFARSPHNSTRPSPSHPAPNT